MLQELRRRISATISGWDCPPAKLHHSPNFEQVAHLTSDSPPRVAWTKSSGGKLCFRHSTVLLISLKASSESKVPWNIQEVRSPSPSIRLSPLKKEEAKPCPVVKSIPFEAKKGDNEKIFISANGSLRCGRNPKAEVWPNHIRQKCGRRNGPLVDVWPENAK